MKYVKLFILIILSVVLIYCSDKAGIKLVVKNDSILDAEKKFLPLLLEKIGELDIPDQTLSFDAKLFTIYVSLSNIHISIKNLLSQNIKIELIEPNIIRIYAGYINGSGNFNVQFKAGFIKETDRVTVDVKRIDLQVDITLSQQESIIPGKFLPTGWVSNVDFIVIDFDFDIHGSVIAGIVDLVKSAVKNYIKSQITSKLKDSIIEESKTVISNLVNKIPVYYEIMKDGLAIDISLISAPKIENNFLVLNANGALVNNNIPDSKNPPYPIPETLPDYDLEGKNIQVFLTDYSINTAMNTFFLSGKLEYTIKSEDIPDTSPIKLDTTYLDAIINGLSNVYGKDKKVNIYCKATESPTLSINGKVDANVIGNCALYVQLDSGEYDKALSFKTQIQGNGTGTIKEEGKISAEIDNLQLTSSEMIDCKVPDANIKNVEMLFNFTAKLILPVINSKYLKEIKINIPSIEGIEFVDSNMSMNTNFIEVSVTPIFNERMRNYLKKEEKLFLLWS